jgi:L-glyceraldehyde 3-phosphate reductase
LAALVVEHVCAGRHLVQGIEGFHEGAFHADPRHVDTGGVVAAIKLPGVVAWNCAATLWRQERRGPGLRERRDAASLGSPPMEYIPSADRYETMPYRRCGRSGLMLPPISLGLWHNFGRDRPFETQQEICGRAFDLGVTHFDLANNYGPPYGSAEENFGRMLATDFAAHRDELVISTKAGYDMWPGPYGEGGSRKYLLASLDQSLGRMGLDYVDIFYSHRFDPDTPLEETMSALATAITQGKALYAGISSYSSARTVEAARLLADLGVPLLIHQPSYSMFNRWIESDGLLDTLEAVGAGCIAFSPLAQGLLTDRYLDGIPADSRVATGGAMSRDMLTEDNLAHVRALADLAEERGQSLAQMALAWALRDPRMTSLVIGASSVSQLEADLAALDSLAFTEAELDAIDKSATDADINLWAASSRE